MRLYGIAAEDVEEVFRDPGSAPETEGNRMALVGKPTAKFSHRPLKVGSYVVLSVYPLKRVYQRPKS
jgi:hypothetical protein